MEVKIGIQHAPKEVVVESSQNADEVYQAVDAAWTKGNGMLTLVDDKGRRVMVPVAKIAYVEIASPQERRVGFGG